MTEERHSAAVERAQWEQERIKIVIEAEARCMDKVWATRKSDPGYWTVRMSSYDYNMKVLYFTCGILRLLISPMIVEIRSFCSNGRTKAIDQEGQRGIGKVNNQDGVLLVWGFERNTLVGRDSSDGLHCASSPLPLL